MNKPSFCTALLVHVRLRRELGNIGSLISIVCLHVFCMFFPTVELLRHPIAQLGVHMYAYAQLRGADWLLAPALSLCAKVHNKLDPSTLC